jgi:hypothetical protein
MERVRIVARYGATHCGRAGGERRNTPDFSGTGSFCHECVPWEWILVDGKLRRFGWRFMYNQADTPDMYHIAILGILGPTQGVHLTYRDRRTLIGEAQPFRRFPAG